MPRISNLPAAGAITGEELIPVVQEGITRRSTAASIRGDSGISANTLAASDGSSLVGFLQDGSGAEIRTAQSKLRETVSLLDFIPAAEHAAIVAGGSAYDCTAAMQAAVEAVTTNATLFYSGGARIRIPPGDYYFASPIELKKTVIIEGDAVGEAGGYATRLRFASDTTGIIVQRFDTIGAGVESPATTGADATIIRNLELFGSGSGPRDVTGTGHGIWLRARARIENVRVSYFAEDGIRILANSSGTGSERGNANGWRVDTARISNCGGHGLYVSGPDANAGTAIGVNCAYNGEHGISDNSFLGNTYVGCQVDRAGMKGQVSHVGNRYFVLSDTLGGATEPGTDSTVWYLYGAGGVHDSYPAWVSGADYVTGYPFVSTSNNAINTVFVGCYWESGQPYAHILPPAIVVGGVLGNSFVTPLSTAFRVGSTTQRGKMTPYEITSPAGATLAYTVRYCAPNVDEAMNLFVTGDHANGFSPFMWDATNGCWASRHASALARTPVRYTTNLNTITGSRPSAIGGGEVLFAQGFWLGSSTNRLRKFDTENAAPTTGTWARGDIRFNSSPSAGGKVGWVCTTAGTPGTWKAFGVIDP
jgi:hypothetical protein